MKRFLCVNLGKLKFQLNNINLSKELPERMDVFCAMRIILNEIKDVGIVGVEEADVVMAPELDAGVEAPLVLSPFLACVP